MATTVILDDIDRYPEFLKKLKQAKSVCVVTGAGVSAESGIPTFRGDGGLWKNFRAEELASPAGFKKNPALVWEWYSTRREFIANNKPNPGHDAIAKMEKHFEEFLLVTQNVDGYHLDSGSQQVVEIHGSIWELKCTEENKIWEDRTLFTEFPIYCSCGALARPNVLWFGESYDQRILAKSFTAAMTADLFIVAGTSGMVWIAAGLLQEATRATSIELNLESSELTQSVDYFIKGPSGQTLPRLLESMIHG